MEPSGEGLRAELRAIGQYAQDGMHSPRAHAYRAILAASAAGEVSPDQAGHWTREWLAASGAQVSAKAMPSAVSKVKVWIMAGKTEAGVATLAALDVIASANPSLAGRYSEKATTALRTAARLERALTWAECEAILSGAVCAATPAEQVLGHLATQDATPAIPWGAEEHSTC